MVLVDIDYELNKLRLKQIVSLNEESKVDYQEYPQPNPHYQKSKERRSSAHNFALNRIL